MIEIVAFAVTYILLGAIGYLLSRRSKQPLTVPIFIVFFIMTILSQTILPSTRLIGVFGFNIYFGSSLQALLAGILLGRTIRAIRTASR